MICRGGANANALRVHLLNGHKVSYLLLIVQEKAKVNAISKEKRMRRAKDPKRSSNINNVRK